MIVHLSIHAPKAGKERDLLDSMHRFGAASAERHLTSASM